MDNIGEIVNKILISLFPSVSRHCHRRLCSAAAAAVPPLLLNSFGNRFHYSLDYCTISNSIYLTFIQVESFISDLLKYSYTAIWCWLCLCFVECIWSRIWTETLQRIRFFPTKSTFQGNEKKSVFVVWKSTPFFFGIERYNSDFILNFPTWLENECIKNSSFWCWKSSEFLENHKKGILWFSFWEFLAVCVSVSGTVYVLPMNYRCR